MLVRARFNRREEGVICGKDWLGTLGDGEADMRVSRSSRPSSSGFRFRFERDIVVVVAGEEYAG
jgi:hypothetical protein